MSNTGREIDDIPYAAFMLTRWSQLIGTVFFILITINQETHGTEPASDIKNPLREQRDTATGS